VSPVSTPARGGTSIGAFKAGTVRLALHSFSFEHHRRHGRGFDVYALIDAAVGLGLAGIHISLNDATYRWIGGTAPERLSAVREALRARGLFVEVDTSGTDPDHLIALLDAARMLGADRLRTYVTLAGDPDEMARAAVVGLRAAAPIAAGHGITILLENHEDFTGREVARILEDVDHDAVGAVYDFGNSMMVMEDPMVTAKAMAPFVRSVHVKDQIVAVDAPSKQAFVYGVPIGRGTIPIEPILAHLLATTDLDRLCVQSVHGYRAPFARNAERLDEAAARYPTFAPVPMIADEAAFLADAEALARIDPARLLNRELGAVAWGIGRLREILADLGFKPSPAGHPGEYRKSAA